MGFSFNTRKDVQLFDFTLQALYPHERSDMPMTIHLDPEQQKLAEQLVATGRFSSIKEAVGHALRALVEDEEHTSPLSEDAFLSEIQAGIDEADRGKFVPLPSVDELITEANADPR